MRLTDSRIKRTIENSGGNFVPEEFFHGRNNLKNKAVKELVEWRNWMGFKFQITSAYRQTGSHKYGSSFDGLIWSKWKTEQPEPDHIWRLMTTWKWHGVGIYFDWKNGIGSHVDIVPRTLRTRPLRWIRVEGTYYYQDLKTGIFRAESGKTTTLENEIQIYNF